MKKFPTFILLITLLLVFSGCIGSLSSSLPDKNPDSLYFQDVTSTHFPQDPEAHILNPVLVDIDGDGDLDVIMALEVDVNRLYLNDGTGKFTWVPNVFSDVKYDTEHVRIADFDKDGNIDVIFVAEDHQIHEFYLGNGDGTFRDASDRLLAMSEGNGLEVGDVNGDGLIDIVIGNSGEKGQNFLWLNDKNNPGHFIDVTATYLPQVNDATQSIALADLDGDGDLDMVVGNEVPPNRLLINDGTGVFSEKSEGLDLPVPLETRMVLLFDVDNDGDKDIVFSNLTSNGRKWKKDPQVRVLINDGNANFKDETESRMPKNKFSSYASQYIDFDGDGDLDLLISTIEIPGFNPLQVRAYENDGDGYFTDITEKAMPNKTVGRNWDLAVGDVNGDGIDDVVIGGRKSQARLLFGNKNLH
jgi:hypothetical protein